MFQRSSGSAPVEFVLILAPLLFTTILSMNVIWFGYEKAQLTVIATRAAEFAALADTSIEESRDFAVAQLIAWLGKECDVAVAVADFAEVAITCGHLEVRASAISELY